MITHSHRSRSSTGSIGVERSAELACALSIWTGTETCSPWKQPMKTTLMFTLPFPPSVNTYYRTYLGRMLISKKGREYRRAVLAEIVRQKVTQGLGDARLALTVGCHRGDKRKVRSG